MMPSQTGSMPGMSKSAGATIGTTTKMISKASMTKPSRNTASITTSMAPALPPGECAVHHVVAAERTEDQAERRGADQNEEDHSGDLRGLLHHGPPQPAQTGRA